jgi:hypothetical protein
MKFDSNIILNILNNKILKTKKKKKKTKQKQKQKRKEIIL